MTLLAHAAHASGDFAPRACCEARSNLHAHAILVMCIRTYVRDPYEVRLFLAVRIGVVKPRRRQPAAEPNPDRRVGVRHDALLGPTGGRCRCQGGLESRCEENRQH